jgi:hypothetical protein
VIATRQSVLAVLSRDWHPPKTPGLSILTDERWWNIFHWGSAHGHELPGWESITLLNEGMVRVDYLMHSDKNPVPVPVHPSATFLALVPPPIPPEAWLR